MKVTLVVGARPNFMKAAPVYRALLERDVEVELLHTGQHYDEVMSESFLRDLGLPAPDVNLAVGSGSHARQTADVLVRCEEHLRQHPRDLVVVVGDVNSTVAASMAAVKLHVPVAHVEAGLRSGDRRMPEEINRVITDSIASLWFVTEPSGVDHLRAAGAAAGRVHLVGNTMIDTLLRFRDRARSTPPPPDLPGRFGVVTLHRPSNVDEREVLAGILDALEEISGTLPLWWPVHPRTRQRLAEFGLAERVQRCPGLREAPPAGYLEFLGVMARSALLLTDSGGIQEEGLVLRVPVVTLRENTERPVTIECGGNVLSGPDPGRILAAARDMLSRDPGEFRVPELWDGHAGERIADCIVAALRDGLTP